jgi:endonuclease/exonuclease/phosphatase family metal-dependent hydrolase
MRVVTWNLFHGRSLPPAREALLTQFAAKLAEWEWDVALLQEVPPWWPQALADASGAQQRRALTSRNALLPLRRAVAKRRPELIKSNGGGCNAVLSRAPICEHSTLRLRLWPERRVAQLVRLCDGTCVMNFHASTRRARAEQELARLWEHALAWAEESPLILGGDLNLREPRAPGVGVEHVAAHEVDHVFARGFGRGGGVELLDRGIVQSGRRAELSDHAPVWVALRASAGTTIADPR